MKSRAPIYLDYAAATPLDPDVEAAMQPYFAVKFYNPSASYLAAQAINKDINAARGKIAHWLGARPEEIIFTAGGTEANNLAIRGILEVHPDTNLVVSAIEHESVLAPANLYPNKQAKVLPDGRIDIDDLESKIDAKTVLVSVMYANNEMGAIQPLSEIAQLISAIRQKRLQKGNRLPLYLHTDACQAPLYLDLHTHRLGVDLLTINGGKIYGPKQSGALFVRAGVTLKPQILGGGQEAGQRSGTQNVPAIIGLAHALNMAQTRRGQETKRLKQLQELFYTLLGAKLPNSIVNGTRKHRLASNIHVTLPGQDNERILIQLDQAGIMCAAGSACSASQEEPSHVLKALGLSDKDAQASLRFSMGRQTDDEAIRRTVETLAALL